MSLCSKMGITRSKKSFFSIVNLGIGKGSFNKPNVVKDLVLAFDWSKKRIIKKYCSDSEDDGDSDFEGEDYSLMRVCELRRKLDEKGLGVDGSREAMIEALDNSTGSASYVNNATVED